MSNYPNLPRTVWIVCLDVYHKGEGLAYTMTRRVFLDRQQAQQYCEGKAAESDYKWSSVAQEWCSSWRRDGRMKTQYRMYLSEGRLEQPVAQQEEVH
jgi:hypothetical protein